MKISFKLISTIKGVKLLKISSKRNFYTPNLKFQKYPLNFKYKLFQVCWLLNVLKSHNAMEIKESSSKIFKIK